MAWVTNAIGLPRGEHKHGLTFDHLPIGVNGNITVGGSGSLLGHPMVEDLGTSLIEPA